MIKSQNTTYLNFKKNHQRVLMIMNGHCLAATRPPYIAKSLADISFENQVNNEHHI